MGNRSISEDTLRNVCKISQGAACCRYISCGPSGFECEKHSAFKSIIDGNINNMVAKGDNCEGLK